MRSGIRISRKRRRGSFFPWRESFPAGRRSCWNGRQAYETENRGPCAGSHRKEAAVPFFPGKRHFIRRRASSAATCTVPSARTTRSPRRRTIFRRGRRNMFRLRTSRSLLIRINNQVISVSPIPITSR